MGTVSSLLLIALSPTVMVDLWGFEAALFSLKNPAIITIPLGFVCGIVVSLIWPEAAAAEGYEKKERRMILGVES